MTDKEKNNWQLRIDNKVVIKHEKKLRLDAEKNMEAAKMRSSKILEKHQKKQKVGSIFWYCRKLGVDASMLAVDLGLNGFLKNNSNDQLEMMLKDLKDRYIILKNS